MKFKCIIALMLTVMLSGCALFAEKEENQIMSIQKFQVSEFEEITDKQLEYLISNADPSEYVPDYNYVETGDFPKGSVYGMFGHACPSPDRSFEDYLNEYISERALKNKDDPCWKMDKISETDAYVLYNTTFTSTLLEQPRESNYLTLFLKGFAKKGETYTYTGEMTAEAVKANFDIFMCKSRIMAREVTETDDAFVYEYVDYENCSGFWSNFYRFRLMRITIHKENGTITEELISQREPENMSSHAFDWP